WVGNAFVSPFAMAGGVDDTKPPRLLEGPPYSFPLRISSFSVLLSFLLLSGGGITKSGLVELMRRTSWLVSGFPGTTARRPESAGLSASSRTSSRNPAWRSLGSGPWHLKQLLERVGRMSRL